jgi:two-component system sensor histidine kinase SenX3
VTLLSAGALGVAVGFLLAVLAWWLVRLSERWQAAETATAPDPYATVLPRGVQDVLSVLRAGGIVVDRSGRVLTASSSSVAFGLVRGQDLLHEGLRSLVSAVQRDGVIREGEYEIARGPLGAGIVIVSCRVAPIGDDLVVILVEDRTQARRVEEVRRDFVVNVSHELKTPVGGLALLAEAVEDAADDPEAVARFAGRMKGETRRLTRLVSEIVDLSRLQTNDLLADMVIVDVAACAAEAVDHTRLLGGQRELEAVSTQDPAGLRVYGDRELITTAIRNLVTNAISYSEDGTKVTVVTRRVDDVVEVSVTDQGRGISLADQERIFERFYRVDAARSRSTGGTGLGLSIVKHICANHGGEVTVWSQEGQGATFTMRLPAVVDDDRPVGALAPHRPGQRPRVADPAHGDAVPSGASRAPSRTRKER